MTSRPAGADTDIASSYRRSGHSASLLVESLMAMLEGGAVAAAFTSAASVVQSLLAGLQPGDHVLFDTGTYYEFARIFRDFGRRWGVDADQVDLTDLDAVRLGAAPGSDAADLVGMPDQPALARARHRRSSRIGARGPVPACSSTRLSQRRSSASRFGSAPIW